MLSESIEPLVAERVAQLDAITQRRNALLREMYRMIQQRHNAGALLQLDGVERKNEDEEEGLMQFMDRFDLNKNPESGMVANLLDSELFVPSPFIPSEEVAEEVEEVKEPAEPDVGSPMSEPPASPAHVKSSLPLIQREEDEEAEIDGMTETVEAEIAESESPMPLRSSPSLKRPREEEEEEEEKEEEEEEESPLDQLQAPVVSLSRSPPHPASTSAHFSPSVSHYHSRSQSQALSSRSPKRRSVEPDPAIVQHIIKQDSTEPMEGIIEESLQQPAPSPPPQFSQSTAGLAQTEDSIIDTAVPSPPPASQEPPRPMVIHTAVDVQTIQPSLLIPTPTSPTLALTDFSFNDAESEIMEESPPTPTPAENKRHHFNPDYNLPPLKALPPEYLRRGKSSKQKKKEKDKVDGKGGKEEWAPLGFAKWGAVIRANPIHKKVSRAVKCMSTKDWGVVITELRLLRTLERVEALENVAKWSYRQPKKQRNLGGMTKTHWDYLLDEMKWIRVDFREERKWKYVLAFNLSTAVLEWHEAQTREERIKLGICMHWKRPRATSSPSTSSHPQRQQEQSMDVDMDGVAGEQGDKENSYSDQESGDDDDDGEVEQREIVDALETRNVLEEALEASGSGSGSGDSADSSRMQSVIPDGAIRPKLEDVEDSSALGNANGTEERDGDGMEIDGEGVGEAEGGKEVLRHGESTQATKTEVVDLIGLKANSIDPILGSVPDMDSQDSNLPVASSSKSVSKPNAYAPLRERIAYSDFNKLFIDHDDLDLVKAMSNLTTLDSSLPPSLDLESTRHLDLSDLFPDLQSLAMPDVTSSGTESRKKSDKKSERDDNKRVDDSGYTKMAPMGKFMLCKPTLLGPLQPVRRWKNGKWLPPEESAVMETESSSSKITDDQLSDLFDGVKPLSIGGSAIPHPPKDNRKRPEHAWAPSEDMLLKSIVEKYPSNWTLVADAFNCMRVTISIDKRTPWECLERWNLKFGGKPNSAPGHADVSPAVVDGTPPPTPSASAQQAQMTTRGVKRLTNINVTQGQSTATGPGISSDTMKRRRHTLMYETIRKTAKKREATQKAASMNQRKPSNIHDTHGQYNKMPKLTPAELSRMKAEKEARDQQEMLLLRRRHEELARQHALRAQGQTPVAAGTASQQPQPQQSQAQQQPQQQQPQPQQPQSQPGQAATGTPRSTPQPTPPVPQIRAQQIPQVNISQQQRIPTPMSTAAVAAARMSPQQMLQVQAAQAQARANAITAAAQSQAQVHAQLQAQAQAQGTPQAVLASLPAAAHLSPPYQSRAATTSPGVGVAQHASPPPRTVGTPASTAVVGSPRPPSAQAQPQPSMSSPQIAANAMPRPAGTIPAHYLPVVPPGAHFTQEQMDQAMRLSSLMQRTAMAQAQQGGQYPQN